MHGTNEYTCPICNEGTTCGCITVNSDAVAIALELSDNAEKYIENDICEDCHEEKATVHYPIQAWLGEYKDICSTCFKNRLLELEEKYSKQ